MSKGLRVLVLSMSCIITLCLNNIATSAGSIEQLLKQYDYNIYQYTNDLTALENDYNGSSDKEAEYILGINNSYKSTYQRLEQEIQDKHAVAQQVDNKETETTLAFRKELMSSINDLGNINNLSYPVEARALVVGSYGSRLDMDGLKEIKNADDIILYVPQECNVLAQFNGTVTDVAESALTIQYTDNIKMVYSGLSKVTVKKNDKIKQNSKIGVSGRNNMDWSCINVKLLYKDKPLNPGVLY